MDADIACSEAGYPPERDLTDLESAVEEEDANQVREILRQNPGLARATWGEPEDIEWWSPLHTACVNGNVPIVEALLDSGADTNRLLLVDDDVLTPLELALDASSECVELLIAHGAPIVINGGVTLLHKAAYECDFRLALALLVRGAMLDIFAAAGLGLAQEVLVRLKAHRGLAKTRLSGWTDAFEWTYEFG